jgi:HEAT repeat protein
MYRYLLLWAVIPLAAVSISTAFGAETDAEPILDGKRLSVWLQQLDSENKEERRRAAETLEKWAIKARSIAPALFAAVQRKKGGEVNEAAANAVLRLGSAAVPALLRALWSEEPHPRRIALSLLGYMGEKARPAIPSMRKMLADKDATVRFFAVRALGGVHARSAIPDLLPLLEGEDARLRQQTLGVLMQLNCEAETLVPLLIRWLRGEDEERRLLAAQTLEDLGGEAVPAIAALMAALRDENGDVKSAAARALGRMGPSAKEAVPALTATLEEDHRWINMRPDVAEALWRIARHEKAAPALKAWLKNNYGHPPQRIQAACRLWAMDQSAEAIAVLAVELRSGEMKERRLALQALTRIGPGAKAALPMVVASLQDKDLDLRFAAVQFLGRLGEHGKAAAGDVKKVLDDRDVFVRLAAALTLWRIEKDPVRLDLLARDLTDKNVEVRRMAAEWLSLSDVIPRCDVAALTKALDDADARVRLRAARALWQRDKKRLALAVMRKAVDDEDPAVRQEAAAELGFLLQSEGRPAVAALTKLLWDDEPFLRSDAAEALGRIGASAENAVPALLALMEEEAGDPIQSSVAEALGLIGAAAKPAVPLLSLRLKHPDPYVRVCAALALWHIDRNRAGVSAASAALYNRNPRVRIVAAELLGRAKPQTPAVAALREVLHEAMLPDKSGQGNIRYMAARALGRLGASAKAAVPELLDLLHDEDDTVRSTARQALKRIDPQAASKVELP